MKDRLSRIYSFLERREGYLVFVCGVLFGIAYGLSNERSLVPIPAWYTPGLHRFCLALMVWTALTHHDNLHRLIWSFTDSLVLSLPFLAGMLYPPFENMVRLIDYEIRLGKFCAAATFGIAITQGFYSLIPSLKTLKKR